ncbi:Uncharacterized protein Adt_06323 [Abeliophyllum distichum]|uniref:Retrotransposon gag domain-containing protein n=1 Tax=Abeliophyllum distichum TaxID=126358 RepID=A0ABD1V6U0_9LAMI
MADAQVKRKAKQEVVRAAAVVAVQLAILQVQQSDDEEEKNGDGNMPIAQFLTPVVAPDLSSIVYPTFGRHDLQLRVWPDQSFINNLQFYVKAHENLNTLLSEFLWMCRNFQFQDVNDDSIRLMLFYYTLRDGALEWLDSESHASITTWDDLARKFYNKYFSPTKIAKMKLEICTFQQLDGETYHEAWDRLNELLRKCQIMVLKRDNRLNTFTLGYLINPN